MSNSSLQNVQVNPITGEIRINQLTWAVMFANVGAGVTASLWASPIMAVIDGSIINSINGDRRPILAYIKEGLKLLVRHPVTFLRQRWFLCLLCWQVYAGTYTATNCARSLCDVYNLSPEMTDVCKFSTAFVVNVGLSQVKDGSMVKYFTSNFAKSSASQALGSKTYSVPLRTRGLFLTRDAVTMFAAFCLADRLAHAIFDLSSHMLSYKSCSLLTNFVTPAALQPFSTVVHLWALEHAAAVSQGTSTLWKDVFPQIQKKYAISLFSRISRIIPSISIGNNVNNVTRSYLLTEFA